MNTPHRRSILLQLLPIVLVAALLAYVIIHNPGHYRSVLGLFSAGAAIAMTRVITSFAAFFVILTSRAFRVGDRIVMGGVRGDVIRLGYIRTTILEMGQPPPVQDDEPAMWVEARQYTGRIVTVTNDKVFDQPVYNFSREFPFIWEELHIGISYSADRDRAERILLDAARRFATPLREIGEEKLEELRRRYFVADADLEPRVFYKLTENWLELAVRFLVATHGVRNIKDGMARHIINELDQAGIGIASGTYEIVGMPPVRVVMERSV
jgi:small-conductance mechanosensitive channel